MDGPSRQVLTQDAQIVDREHDVSQTRCEKDRALRGRSRGEEPGRRASPTRSRTEEGRQGYAAGGGIQGPRESLVELGAGAEIREGTRELRGMRLGARLSKVRLSVPSVVHCRDL